MEMLSFRHKAVQDTQKDTAFQPAELILGKEVYELEQRLAAWVGTERCVAVSDPASALALALRTAGVNAGDLVICAALGCALPVQGIMLAGGVPVFADINPNTYTLDPFCLEYALEKLRRNKYETPRALIATNLFGAPCHLTELEQICRSRGIELIEDMTASFGAKHHDRMCGSFGRFSVASFASPGPFDEPGGGAVFCRSQGDAEKISALRRTVSQQRIDLGPDIRTPRIGSADASLTDMRLDGMEEEHELRRKAAARYRKNLAGKVRVQKLVDGGQSVYSQLVAALPKGADRPEVIRRLFELNIPSGPPLCGVQSADTEWNRSMLVSTRALAERLLSLPVHAHLNEQVVDFICQSLLEAIAEDRGQKSEVRVQRTEDRTF